jgi:hypothetical protein
VFSIVLVDSSLAGPRILLSIHQRRGLAAGSMLLFTHELSCGVARAAWLVVVAPVGALGESRVGCPMRDLHPQNIV